MVVDIKEYMSFAALDAMKVLSNEFASAAEQELAMKVILTQVIIHIFSS